MTKLSESAIFSEICIKNRLIFNREGSIMAEQKQKPSIKPTKIGDTIRHASHKMEEYGEELAKKSDELTHRSTKMAGNVQHEAEVYVDKVVEYVRENPVKATIIAGLAGLVIGTLIKK